MVPEVAEGSEVKGFAVKIKSNFVLDDFFYSFLFGFLPSAFDIATDFTFASRLLLLVSLLCICFTHFVY